MEKKDDIGMKLTKRSLPKTWLPNEVLQLRYEERYPERFPGESKYLEKIM